MVAPPSHLSLSSYTGDDGGDNDDVDVQYNWEIEEFKKYSKSTASLLGDDGLENGGDGSSNPDEIEQIIQNSTNPLLSFREQTTEKEVMLSLIKGSIGSATIMIPLAFEKLGILFGVAVVMMGMIVNITSVYILSHTCRMASVLYSSNQDPYMITEYVQLSKIFQETFPLSQGITLFLLFFLLISPIICVIKENSLLYRGIIASLIGTKFDPSTSSFKVEFLTCALVLFPMTLISSAKGIDRNNKFSIVAMFYIFLLLLLEFWFNKSIVSNVSRVELIYNSNSSFLEKFSSITTIFYALSNHLVAPHLLSFLPTDNFSGFNVFGGFSRLSSNYNSTNDNENNNNSDIDFKVRKVLAKSFSLTATFYLFIGTLGAFVFPTIGRAFVNRTSIPYLVGQFMFSILNVTSIPLLMMPFPSLIKEFYETNWIFLNGIFVIGLGFILSLLIGNGGNGFIDVVGSLCGSPLFLLLPAFYYNSIIREQKPLERSRWMVRVIAVMNVVGIASLLLGISLLVL